MNAANNERADLFAVVEGRYPTGAGTSDGLTFVYDLDLPEPRKPALLARVESSLGIRPPEPILVIAGTLTLEFDPDSGLLKSIDAYVGDLRTRQDSVRVPEVQSSGQLQLKIELQSGEYDRISCDERWRCRFDDVNRCLHIEFLRAASAPTYYRIGSTLVLGLRDAMISDIFVEDLKIEDLKLV